MLASCSFVHVSLDGSELTSGVTTSSSGTKVRTTWIIIIHNFTFRTNFIGEGDVFLPEPEEVQNPIPAPGSK